MNKSLKLLSEYKNDTEYHNLFYRWVRYFPRPRECICSCGDVFLLWPCLSGTKVPEISLVEKICNHPTTSKLSFGILHPCMPSPIIRISANSVDPDQMPQNLASDPSLHCLHNMDGWMAQFYVLFNSISYQDNGRLIMNFRHVQWNLVYS